jgi:CheY-like chemotaxis protein
MSASEPQLDRVQQRQQARFERMGLACRVMPGGRALLVSLPIGAAPFESLSGPISFERILFSTVGPDQIKCLRPRPVFGLPLLDVRRCADAAAVETMIRQAWRDRTRELRDTARTLTNLGIEVGAIEGGSVLAFSLAGESRDHPILMQRLDEAILPSAGPLSGLCLSGPDERVVDVSGKLDSAADLELLLGSRIEELVRSASARRASARQPRPEPRSGPLLSPLLGVGSDAAITPDPQTSSPTRQPKVLLVGAQIIENTDLRDELTRQGYRLATARSEPEALMRLAGMTPDLVISQYALGRSDGATFAQAIRSLPGIVRIPIVLLDSLHHQSRQDAARAVGAAGYVIEPVEPTRFVSKLARVVASPGDRRFVRYAGRLAARLADRNRACLATEIGRGGFFLATSDPIDDQTEMRCVITLPELRRSLDFVGDVLYRTELQGVERQGIGVRIREISPEDEAALIEYVALRARAS